MKSLSAVACVIVLSLAFTARASATQPPEPLSDAQLDQVAAGASNAGNASGTNRYGQDKSRGKIPDPGPGRNGKSEVAGGVGVVGTGIVALRK